MSPSELREQIKRGVSDWNAKWEGTALTDVSIVRQMSADQEQLLMWAIGRLIAMIEERDNERK